MLGLTSSMLRLHGFSCKQASRNPCIHPIHSTNANICKSKKQSLRSKQFINFKKRRLFYEKRLNNSVHIGLCMVQNYTKYLL